jgi:hypothetical protein
MNGGFWPLRSPGLNPCDFDLWATPEEKVHVNDPYFLEELQEDTKHEIFAVFS